MFTLTADKQEQVADLTGRQPHLTVPAPSDPSMDDTIQSASLLTEALLTELENEDGAMDAENTTGDGADASRLDETEETTLALADTGAPYVLAYDTIPQFSNYDFHYDRESNESSGLPQVLENILQDLAS